MTQVQGEILKGAYGRGSRMERVPDPHELTNPRLLCKHLDRRKLSHTKESFLKSGKMSDYSVGEVATGLRMGVGMSSEGVMGGMA